MSNFREKLYKLDNKERFTFSGIFKETGYKVSYRNYFKDFEEPTFMLEDVKVLNPETEKWEYVCDHLWLNYSKLFKYFYPIEKGDIVTFNGRVALYDYKDGTNVKIKMPSKVRITDSKGVDKEKTKEPVIDDEELIKEIKEENKDYYNARDYFDSLFFNPYYHYSLEKYGGVKLELNINGKWFEKRAFKEKYKKREQILDLYNFSPRPEETRFRVPKGNKWKEISVETLKDGYDNYLEDEFFGDWY